jgi:hypothetical protein
MRAATKAATKKLMEMNPAELTERIAQGPVELKLQFQLDDDEGNNPSSHHR